MGQAKMNTTTMPKASALEVGQISWRYYNIIKKKAVEQEFSLSGLIVSLSIAFFVVVSAAFSLNFVYLNFLA